MRAAEKYIFKYGISAVIQEACLQKVWKICLIQRTYAFCVLFDNLITIEEILPQVDNVIMKTTFTTTEKLNYECQTDALLI